MSTPQGPYGQPPYGPPPGGQPYGQQPYGAGQQPGPYGPPPAPGQPGYAYSPYGSPYGAGLDHGDHAPVRRPGLMILGLIMKIVAALPFLLVGVLILLVPLSSSSFPSAVLDNPQFANAGGVQTLITFARVIGGVLLVVALLYLVFAIFAFQGRNWARILVTVMSAGFAVLLALSLFGGSTRGGSLIFVAVILLLVVGAVVILFLPDSNRYFSRIR